MPSTYTVNLGIEKPATGEQSGTWGDTTNVNFDILDQAINGAERVTLTSAGSSGSPNALNITNGATSDGRNKWIEFYSSGDLGGSAYVQLVPNDAEKIVFIRNSLASSRSVLLFQGTYNSGRDLEIPAGVDMVVKFDGGGASAATVTDVFTKLRATEITTPTLTATTADINGGTIDNSVIGGSTAAAVTGTTVVANTSLNIAGDGATVTGIKDEDDMSSNSATKLATQQSIKAYVDSQVGTVDTWAEVLANGATSGSTNPEVTAGQALKTNTINETSAGSGVTIDSVLLKDDVVNATDIETGSISANDGTASATIANSTGVMTIASSVLTTADINAGTIDNSTIGGSTPAVGTFTQVNVDNITIDGTEIDLSSGNLTIDVAGDIILDADGGDVKFADAGTVISLFSMTNSDTILSTNVTDKDIIFKGVDGGSTITALTLDMSAAGAATFNAGIATGGNVVVGGTLSANSLTIDDITINSSTISDAGNLTIDSGGDIILDADGGDVILKDGGTEIGSISLSGSNVSIVSAVSDEDIFFKGNDGGSSIDALFLDMSAAGAATFNSSVTTGGNITIGNTSLSQTILQFLSATNGANTIHFGDGASADAYKGYINYNHTADRLELVGSGDMLIDVAGEIQLDSDSGIIRVRDAGGDYGMFQISSSDFIVRSMVQDKDLLFKGNDGGSIITALTLDMSAAGEATFNDDINLGDSKRLRMGAGGDFEIFHDGSNNYIKGASSDQDIIFQGVDGGSAITALTLDMSEAGEATFNGDIKLGDGKVARFGTDQDFRIGFDGNNAVLQNVTSDSDIIFIGNDGGSEITALTLDMSLAGTAIFNHDIEMPDAGLLRMGAGGDLILTSDGTNGVIYTNNGNLSLDIAGGFSIDVDGGQVSFSDGGTLKSLIDFTGNNVEIQSRVSDADLLFRGLDGASFITALTLDMSNAGAATFNAGATFGGGITATSAAINGQLNVTGTTNSNNIYAQQLSTQFDTSSFMRFHPTSVTDSGGFTNIFFGTSTANNYGVAVGGKRAGTDGTPSFAVRTLDDSVSGIEVLNITNAGEVTKPYQPAFYATPSSAQTGLLANDSAVTIAFGTEIFDIGSNFASNTFTAPVTGKYQLNLSLYMTTIDTGAGYVLVGIVTSNRNYINILAPKFASDPAYLTQNISTLADMDAGDTAYVYYQQSGGAAQTTVQDDTRGSFFQGYLVA